MHFKPVHASLIFLSAWLFLTNARNPSNPPLGRTGAPGETTCGASGCHTGGAFTGMVALSGLPDTVMANQTYSIVQTNTCAGPVRAGFQLTCLDNANTKCGNLSAAAGCNVATNGANGRQYIRQSTPKNFSGGLVSWTFSWKAPATASGDRCKFYFASLCANGNGTSAGDNPLTANKTVVLRSVSPTQEAPETAKSWVDFQATSAGKTLTISLLQATKGSLEIFDMQGKRVLSTSLATTNDVNVSSLPTGLFVAQIAAEGRATAIKFFQK